MKKIFTYLFLFTSIIFSQDFWEPTNGPFGGNINYLVSNLNGDIFAIVDGDLYRLAKDDDSWTEIMSIGMLTNCVTTNTEGEV